jgi:hypothetical protein
VSSLTHTPFFFFLKKKKNYIGDPYFIYVGGGVSFGNKDPYLSLIPKETFLVLLFEFIFSKVCMKLCSCL